MELSYDSTSLSVLRKIAFEIVCFVLPEAVCVLILYILQCYGEV